MGTSWCVYDSKLFSMLYYMSFIVTKNSPEKLEYWRQYRRDNAEQCKNQRRQWREANRDRIRLCARRSYYRKLLREGRGDVAQIQIIITNLNDQIATILDAKPQ